MISIDNQIRKPPKGRGVIPSAEYLVYEAIIPKLIAKLKRVNTNGKRVKVSIVGKVDKFELRTDCTDEIVINNIKRVMK